MVIVLLATRVGVYAVGLDLSFAVALLAGPVFSPLSLPVQQPDFVLFSTACLTLCTLLFSLGMHIHNHPFSVLWPTAVLVIHVTDK